MNGFQEGPGMSRSRWISLVITVLCVVSHVSICAASNRVMSLEDSGLSREVFQRIERQIESDIADGFTSAQLVVRRHGRLVYQNAWGRVNSYAKNGERIASAPAVTNDTLYDLASNTKMYAVNYALQYLVSHEGFDLDTRISDILGREFSDDVTYIAYKEGDNVPLLQQRRWKAGLTVRNLLEHQGGFPAGPAYHKLKYDQETQEWQTDRENVLYAGAGADSATKERTWKRICQTPLLYEPGTKTLYSDVDYMVLGLVVEKVTGKGLQEYLSEIFWRPMGLKHITYRPLDNGYEKHDCAATELNGNTRDGAVYFPGVRTETLQGEAHDELCWYCMAGVSGHAGLFSNAVDLARLAELMLTGKYGGEEYFSPEVIAEFTENSGTGYGLGWWVQGDHEWDSFFGENAPATVFGHQGWTGTLTVIDPEHDMVIVYLTNKINTPIEDPAADANGFSGGRYVSGRLGFVPRWIYGDLLSREKSR